MDDLLESYSGGESKDPLLMVREHVKESAGSIRSLYLALEGT